MRPPQSRIATIWIGQLFQDVQYGTRVLIRSPGFTLSAVAILALGVGVNLTEFQIFDAALHRHNFRGADSVLQVSRVTRQGMRPAFSPAAADFLRSQSTSFAWLIAEDPTLSTIVDSNEVRTMFVSSDYFADLSIAPSFGRLLDARDSRAGVPAVADLGYDYWENHFGGDPLIIGRTIRVNNQPVEIVGVLPFDFDGINTRRTVIWLPLAVRSLVFPASPPAGADFSHPSQELYANLKPGISIPSAEADLTGLVRELSRRQPLYFHDDDRIEIRLVEQSLLTRVIFSPVFALFVAMILLVLFSACANLGNMLLARGISRQREISIRMAIGAGRGRIVRQLMTESFLLAILGAIAGLAFANVASRVLMYLVGAPLTIHLSMRWPILAAGFVLTVLSAAAFGLPSALQTVNPNRRNTRLRQSLIGVQVAVSCLLLIASSVLAHNGIALASIDIAYDYQNMVVVNPQLYISNLRPEGARRKLDALSDRLATLPGVDRITACLATPFGGRVYLDSLPGLPRIVRNAVAPSYFSAMTLSFARGATFESGDLNTVILSESAARAVFPNQDAIGKTWNYQGADRTVVGVVKDSGANLLIDPDSIEAYIPLKGANLTAGVLILHTRSDPAPLLRLIPSAAAAVDLTVSESLVRSSRDNYLQDQRGVTALIASIGAVAATLAAAGMFAMVAFTVAQRRREFGIRIAIGARPHHVLNLLLAQNAAPVMVGTLAGAILAAGASRVVRGVIVLQDRQTIDPLGFAAGIAAFLVIAVFAALSPSLRALKIDPSATLRED